jgi:transposase
VAEAKDTGLAPLQNFAEMIEEYWLAVCRWHHSRVSNARAEALNNKVKLIVRRGFGYHSPDAVIALAMLSLGGLCPPLPGR